MISEKYADNREKPLGLYDWQHKYNVQDEDPFFEIGARHFSLLEKLPGYLEAMSKERQEASSEYRQHMSDLEAKHQAFAGLVAVATTTIQETLTKMDDMVTREEKLLYHLRELEAQLTEIGTNILGQIDYAQVARPLHERFELIFSKFPMDRIDARVTKLSNAVTELENASLKIETVVEALEARKDSKHDFVIALAGGTIGTTLLIFFLYLLACLPQVLPKTSATAQSTNSPALLSSTGDALSADASEKLARMRGKDYSAKGEPFIKHGHVFIELQVPE